MIFGYITEYLILIISLNIRSANSFSVRKIEKSSLGISICRDIDACLFPRLAISLMRFFINPRIFLSILMTSKVSLCAIDTFPFDAETCLSAFLKNFHTIMNVDSVARLVIIRMLTVNRYDFDLD